MTGGTGRFARAARLVAMSLLLGSVLVACSDDPPQVGTLKTPTPTPTGSSPSASPTPTLTVEQEVEAAVRNYYAELTRAAQTGDTSILKTLTTEGCPCYRPVRVIEAGAKRGELTPDAVWTIDTLKVSPLEGGVYSADVRYRVTGYDVVNQDGKVIDTIAAQSSHFDLSMVRPQDSEWIIGNVFDLEG